MSESNKLSERIRIIGVFYGITVFALGAYFFMFGIKGRGFEILFTYIFGLPLIFHSAVSALFAINSKGREKFAGPFFNHGIFEIIFAIATFIYFIGFFFQGPSHIGLLFLFFLLFFLLGLNTYLIINYIRLKKETNDKSA